MILEVCYSHVVELLQGFPGAVEFFRLVGNRLLFLSTAIDYKHVSTSAEPRASAKSLHQAGPRSEFGDETSSGNIHASFHNLSCNDDSVHVRRAG